MSLQVWLPLNGDLHNQGLSNYHISMMRGSATFNQNGKIGACFYANGVNTIQIENIISDIYNYFGYSLCAWIYIEAQNTSHSGSGIISAGNWNNQILNLALSGWSSDHYTQLQVSGSSWGRTYAYNFNKNTWYHIVVCSDQNKTYAYVNGTLIGDTISGFLPTSIEGNNIAIGGATYYGGMQFFGRINDVRIYDHCLSAKEVEEIAKGLVLHYKLDNNGLGNPNLVKGNYSAITTATTNNLSGTLSFDTSIIPLNDLKGKTLYFSYDYSVEGAKLYNNTGDYTKDRYGIHGNLSYVDSSGTTKTTYPFAGYLTVSGTGRAIQSYTIPADAKQINSLTFGLQPFNKPAANSTATWYIKNCKLEIGQSTSYTPNQNDIHQDSSIIYDSSGYNNNGTIVGSLEATTPSPRYSCATRFDGVTSCIKIPYNEINPDRIFTVNLWFYKNALGSKSYETLFGGPSGFEMDTRAGAATSLSLYMASTRGGAVYSPLNLNEWTMITMARDGTNEFYYVNGELKKTIEAKSMPSGQYRIGAWASDTGQNYYGEISDFRIYTTALTANQIKELYNTSMTIDNNGNIHARELVE